MLNCGICTIAELDRATEFHRTHTKDQVIPDPNNPDIPASIFDYKPVTWEADPGVWHTIFGQMPDPGIWTIGTSPEEAMQEFDKELQARLDKEKKFILPIEEKLRKQIHAEVFKKIDAIMGDVEE